jgi:cytochrome P450
VNPYPVYERIRKDGPLSPTRLGQWVSPSHRVCDAVLRDRRFGVCLDDAEPGAGKDGPGMSFLEMDPPDHTRLRRLATPAFSPKAVATYAGRVERTVSDLLDRAAAAGQFDLVSDFSSPLPIAVITDLLGIPDKLRDDFASYAMPIGTSLNGIKSMRHAQKLGECTKSLVMLFMKLFEMRRRAPGDDIISHLVAAQGEDQITPEEMLRACILLLIAGYETTENLIGNGVLALLGHPEQWEMLRADPEGLAARTTEEVLRWDTPVQRTDRYALQDLELEGQAIRKGQMVVTLLGAANRDPDAFPGSAAFDITRETTAGHLAFSSGIHYCLGQGLARMEARIAFKQLAIRMPGLARNGAVKWRDSTSIRGPLHLPVTAGPVRSSRRPVTASVAS